MGGNNEMSNLEVAHHVCDSMDKLYPKTQSFSKLIQFVADRSGHDWRYAMNIKKIKQQLHWQPQEIFCQGLERTIQFYMLIPPQDAQPIIRSIITMNIPTVCSPTEP